MRILTTILILSFATTADAGENEKSDVLSCQHSTSAKIDLPVSEVEFAARHGLTGMKFYTEYADSDSWTTKGDRTEYVTSIRTVPKMGLLGGHHYLEITAKDDDETVVKIEISVKLKLPLKYRRDGSPKVAYNAIVRRFAKEQATKLLKKVIEKELQILRKGFQS